MKHILMLAAVFAFLPGPGYGQAPAMSHDGQKLPVDMDECARMGRRTLEREGYQIGAAGNNWVSGAREIHRALIICDGAADGTWMNVVVSSASTDYQAAGNEQRLLTNRMSEIVRERQFADRDRDRDWDRDRDRDGDRDRDRDRGDRERRASWLSMTGQQPLPGNAVAGGKEPNHPIPQYVCRAQQDGNLVPGKTVTAVSTDCIIPYSGTEVRKIAFDILTGDADDYTWAVPSAGRPPFYVGNEGGAQLRSCRFELFVRNENKGLQLGKEAAGKCVVGYKGLAYTSDRYEVLYARR